MVHVIKETINQNARRIWGTFKLSDGSTTKFEQTSSDLKRLGDGSWFQTGNRTNNLSITVLRVEQLVTEWRLKHGY